MLRGISLAQHELPLELIARHGLAHRLVSRGGEPEYQFTWPDWNRVLPLWDENGQLRLVPWGVAREERSNLPIGGQVRLETVNAGKWPTPFRLVDIPCSLIKESEIWAFVREGIKGLLAKDDTGLERVWILCEPSSYYYRVMTRGEWMPILLTGERF
jgi:hypothetical protein